MPDIRDVARDAGVSIGTVSRVLNGSGPVKESTKQRVLTVIEQLGYTPNTMAQGMRTRRSQSVGLLLPSLSYPFFTELINAVERICNGAGYTLVVCSAREDDELELRHLRTLVNRQLDGLMLSTVSGSKQTLDELHEIAKTLPVVLIDRIAEKVGFSTVTVDGKDGIKQAVAYLARKGHRRIAYIGLPVERVIGQERLLGYHEAMNEAGLSVNPTWEQTGDLQVESGVLCCQELLSLLERPTAIVAANDMMAIGVIRAARLHGLRIPDDLAVVGFDDVPVAQLVDPPLTTVAQPIQRMGEEVANLLLRKVAKFSSRNRQLVLKTQLIVRGST